MAVSLSNSPKTLSSSWIPAALPSCEMQRVQELTQMGVVRQSTNAPLTWDAIHNLSHDNLTGLPLGHLFHARVDYLLEKTENNFAVVIINCNRFRFINNLYGHQAADMLLQVLARRLQRMHQPSVFLARLRGDRFGLILNKAHHHLAKAFLENLEAELSKAVRYKGQRYQLGFSVAVQWRGAEHDPLRTATTLIADAETTLQHAVRQQQESFVSVVEQPAVCLNQQMSLAATLQDQLTASTLALTVTPIVNLRTGAAHSYHVAPTLQMNGEDVPFETLMLHAERAGIMNALQQHVFAKSIERYAAANVERTYLNIPISPMDISNQGLANYLSTLMRKHNLPSHSVRLDVHTPKPTRCWQQAIEDLFELQQIGTPFHAARQNGRSQHANNISGQSRQRVYWIPGSLLERALKKPSEQQMLTTLVDLARSLGIDTMASRVTSQAQADLALQSGMLYGCGPAIAGDVPLTMVR